MAKWGGCFGALIVATLICKGATDTCDPMCDLRYEYCDPGVHVCYPCDGLCAPRRIKQGGYSWDECNTLCSEFIDQRENKPGNISEAVTPVGVSPSSSTTNRIDLTKDENIRDDIVVEVVYRNVDDISSSTTTLNGKSGGMAYKKPNIGLFTGLGLLVLAFIVAVCVLVGFFVCKHVGRRSRRVAFQNVAVKKNEDEECLKTPIPETYKDGDCSNQYDSATAEWSVWCVKHMWRALIILV